MEKKWILKNEEDTKLLHQLAKDLNLTPDLTSILVQRGINSFDSAKTFFRPSLSQLLDPFLMKNMDQAVNRLCDAVFNNEKIVVYGDYDVDGISSVAMVYSFLKELTEHVEFYIPDRYTEGYGISEKGVKWAAKNEFSLMIALDCGIRAVDKVELANSLELDMIICDHHLPGEKIPEAIAVLDPKQSGCNYPFKELSGCGVGFKLLQGFCLQNTIPLERLFNYLDLVAVSIGSDIVPIVGENRVLTYYGLKKLNLAPSLGLKSLIDVSGMKKHLSISDVVFYIGPRINATGRLTHAKESVNLLISKSEADLADLSKMLNERNTERKEFDKTITEEALKMIEEDFPDTKSCVLFKKDWHKGVVGIVASRCIDQYYRPTIILTESEGKATGSARSVRGFDVHEAIGKCRHLLEQFGGHTHAAGLSLPLENVAAFREAFEEIAANTLTPDQLIPKLHIDRKITLDFVNLKNIKILNQMAPFGPQNLQPVFWSEKVFVKKTPRLIKDAHLKLMVYQKGNSQGFDAIAFGLGEWAEKIEPNIPFEIAYHIEENTFQGNEKLQLNVKDIKLAE